jgi:predicted nuclease of predicted toxin-antitoxin system
MNLSPRWVDALAGAGHDAIHWSTVGRPNASDHELIAWAIAEGRTFLTADLDYPAILAAGRHRRPSVVLLRSEAWNPESMTEIVVSALAWAETELISGAIVAVDMARARLRILPLQPD